MYRSMSLGSRGKKNIIKIQELTLYQSPTCHRTNTKIPNKSPGTARRVLMQSLLCRLLSAQNFRPVEFLISLLLPTEPCLPCFPTHTDQGGFLAPAQFGKKAPQGYRISKIRIWTRYESQNCFVMSRVALY